jgi:hypothetical protein
LVALVLLMLVICSIVAANLIQAGNKITFSNGSRFRIWKVSYGRNNVYYANPIRRGIASNQISERIWKEISTYVPALPKWLRITNRCTSYDNNPPILVVFGEARIKDFSERFWEFRCIAKDGTEIGVLNSKWLDNYDQFAMGQPKKLGGILGTITGFEKEPQSVRIYEVNSNSHVRKLLVDLPITERTK